MAAAAVQIVVVVLISRCSLARDSHQLRNGGGRGLRERGKRNSCLSLSLFGWESERAFSLNLPNYRRISEFQLKFPGYNFIYYIYFDRGILINLSISRNNLSNSLLKTPPRLHQPVPPPSHLVGQSFSSRRLARQHQQPQPAAKIVHCLRISIEFFLHHGWNVPVPFEKKFPLPPLCLSHNHREVLLLDRCCYHCFNGRSWIWRWSQVVMDDGREGGGGGWWCDGGIKEDGRTPTYDR